MRVSRRPAAPGPRPGAGPGPMVTSAGVERYAVNAGATWVIPGRSAARRDSAHTWSVTGAVGAASERTAALADVARSSTFGISSRTRKASTEISPAHRKTVSIDV